VIEVKKSSSRLPIVALFIIVSAWIVHFNVNFEPSVIVILAPALSTILALVALFTPPENLAALIRSTIRVWQSEL
jgi:hypothetical protein